MYVTRDRRPGDSFSQEESFSTFEASVDEVERKCYTGMECNKEEALHAKHVAEKKFQEGDFTGAKRLITKAMRLDPSLDGLSHMLPIIDIHVLANQKLPSGEMDWYRILQVEADAEEGVIKSQYKKLALQFHPDKNKSIGAESAFKLICDAWNVLSDSSKKLLHDTRRDSLRSPPVNPSTAQVEPQHSLHQTLQSIIDEVNVYDTCSASEQVLEKRVEEQLRQEAEKRRKIEEKLRSKDGEADTNLTSNEMEKQQENKGKTTGKAKQQEASGDMAKIRKRAPKVKAESINSKFKILEDSPDTTPEGTGTHAEKLKKEDSKVRPVQQSQRVTRSSSRQVPISPIQVPETSPVLVMDGEQAQEADASEGLDNGKQVGKRKISFEDVEMDPQADEGYEKELSGASVKDRKLKEKYNEESSGSKFISIQEGKHASITPPNTGGQSKRRTPTPETPRNRSKAAFKVPISPASTISPASISPSSVSPVEASTRLTRSMLRDKGKQVAGSLEGEEINHDHAKVAFSPEAQLQHRGEVFMDVVLSKFCDFDSIRTRKHLKAQQIWAVYDDKDGMPRFYCRLLRVSRTSLPFKAKLAWLEPTLQTEQRYLPVWREDSSFSAVCGEFEEGQTAETAHVNIFSHCIFDNVKDDPVTIYPLKHEIWALYKDWNIRLAGKKNLLAFRSANNEYELVEVAEEYSELQGVAVIRLVQAPGFQSIFHRHGGSDAVLGFSPSQLQAFSHRVLARKVRDSAKHGLPDEAWELDPAALPESMMGN
ncbi:hypothetical protein R1flu_024854 [Riccia fluitans]|uniref:J domain-containing protein n=1 Tax=Riccia fluitans TaxID=41844 RepID=A0ABD1XW34_9MARC